MWVYFKHLSLEWGGWFELPRPGKRVFVNIITIRAMFLVFLVNNFKTWENVLLQSRSFVCFTKLQRSWMFCFWVQRCPSQLLQDIKDYIALHKKAQEYKGIQKYTIIQKQKKHSTMPQEAQEYTRRHKNIREDTENTVQRLKRDQSRWNRWNNWQENHQINSRACSISVKLFILLWRSFTECK